MTRKGTDQFYNSTRWKKLRQAVLRRDNYTCRDCRCKALGRNRNGISPHVDHIRPRSKAPELQWAPGNLVTRCHACHNRKTKAEQADRPTIGHDGFPLDW